MGEMDRSACLKPRTAGALLQRCLYADAVMPTPSLCDREVGAEVPPPQAISYFVFHFLL